MKTKSFSVMISTVLFTVPLIMIIGGMWGKTESETTSRFVLYTLRTLSTDIKNKEDSFEDYKYQVGDSGQYQLRTLKGDNCSNIESNCLSQR